jgi:hypothetical protein
LYRSEPRCYAVMKTITAISISLLVLGMVACSSPSSRRAKEQREDTTDSVQYSYGAGSVKCVSVSVTAYRNDSVVYYNEMAFVKNSKKAIEWSNTESDNVIRYNSNVDSVRVRNNEFSVIR